MSPRLRVAAIGLGWVCQHRHLPAMNRSERFDVVGVIDRTPGRAAETAKRQGYRYHAEAETLAAVDWLDEVDAVTVATAPMAHFTLVSEALARGKHVLTEKPFTMRVKEGAQLLEAASAADRRLAIVHNFQFARSTRKLMAEIAAGKLGTIRGVDAVQFGNPRRRLPTWCEELPFGLFYDESPHLLYLMRAVAGALSLERSFVVAGSTGQNTPSRIEAWFRGTDLECPVRMSCNFESSVSEWYLMVTGDKGLGIVDVFRDILILLPNDGRHATLDVLRTSRVATFQHWFQHVTSGLPHLTGRLSYGNAELFDRFARGCAGEISAMAPISGEAAQAVLTLQHAVIDKAEAIYR